MWRFAAAGALAGVLAACGQGAAAPALAPADAAAAAPTASPRPAEAGLAGVYRNAGPRTGELRVTPAGDGWRLSLRGGSDPTAGAAAAADCELVAEGPLRNGRISAAVVPFEGETTSVTAQDLLADPASVTAQVTSEGVRITTDYAGCGLGADLSGLYRRDRAAAATPAGSSAVTQAAQPQAGDTVADLSRAEPDARLRVVEGYPWARFALLGPDDRERARLRLDGENADFADGSNTLDHVGETVGWSALKPDLRVEAVEPPGAAASRGESGASPA